MKTTYYKKQGRRYIPVSEYEYEFSHSLSYGNHLISVRPGCSTRICLIEPAFAPMIAASLYAKDAICDAIINASESRPVQTNLTQVQQEAWENFKQTMGNDFKYLHGPSAREVAEAGIKAMQEEADKMMKHESVRAAWDHFMLVYELTKTHENQ